ncbi:MAG: VWA domain-containing protein, partial [Planctomycetota bacterium]
HTSVWGGRTMFARLFRIAIPQRRRGVVAVQVAVMFVVLIGFAALTVDLGAMYNTKADLQRSCDAAALAAASKLSDWSHGDPTEAARQAALDYVQRNAVLGHQVQLDPAQDIVFGRAAYNPTTRQYDFTPTDIAPDAVNIRLRHTEDSPNGPVALYFARIFGRSTTEMSSQATAIMVPRDIAVVADLSASHTDDSEFRNYQSIEINLFDVWDGLPGGSDDVAACDGVTCAGGNVCSGGACVPSGPGARPGPTWGYMNNLGFGTDPVTTSYNPTTDAGLIRLPYNSNWTDATLRANITAQGYSAAEVNAIMDRTYDASGGYPYRVAVALGLAYWNSGLAGGLWQARGAAAGNNNNWISSSETEWREAIFSQSMSGSGTIWLDYINNYMRGTSNEMYYANSNLRYRYGVKTFVNYLMERRPSNAQTPELAQTTTQPMQAVKEAVGYLTAFIDDLDTDDQVSLEIYGTTGRHEVNLTRDYASVSNRLAEMQASHYDGWTNVGGGLQRAIEELTGTRARHTSKKMIILLTDGNANVTESGATGDESGGNAYAMNRAQAAADLGISVFAVSVGVEGNQSLMQEIADTGNGEHFHAEGTIDQYSAQLADIFRRLGGTRPVELIR